MTNAHTPKLSAISLNPVPQMGYYNIEDDQGGIIGRVVSSARAAQMVNACNAHDDLVKALEELTQHATKLDLMHPRYDRARAALAKARGE